MDWHKYVKVPYHGFCELTQDDRQTMYGNTLSRESYDEPDYALINTLFSLVEAYLFMQLVDFKPDRIPSSSNNYSQLYKDVRAAVDLCHRDGTLKQAVANEPSKQFGRKTFLVTNRMTNGSPTLTLLSLEGGVGAVAEVDVRTKEILMLIICLSSPSLNIPLHINSFLRIPPA